MGKLIDDGVKHKLLDELSKEPPMVISTAYTYAKNYTQYGEDITKAWTTAVQQASILEKVRQNAWVEAYDSFKRDYETRLKADMVAMLTDLQLEIDDLWETTWAHDYRGGFKDGCIESNNIIQQKIDKLKAESEEK